MISFFPPILTLTSLIIQLQSGKNTTDPCTPQQVHIALSDTFTFNPSTNNTIKAIFHTQDECNSAYISLKTSQGTLKTQATSVNFFTDTYKDGTYSTYVHIFDFPELEFSQIYEYSCFGSDDNSSSNSNKGPFEFYLPSPKYDGQENRVITFGDMDSTPNGMTTINRLINISKTNFTSISAFIHNGDIAYILENNAGKKGDSYMKKVQEFTATIPDMVTADNHETLRNFSNF